MPLNQFVDPYNYQEDNSQLGMSWDSTEGDGHINTGSTLWEKIATGLGLAPDNAASYERYVAQQNRDYERQSVASARAWDEYMDSTKVQRMVKDIEAAGLNPWLALNGGSIGSGSSANSASAGGSARQSTNKKSGRSGISDLAMFMIATAKLFTAFM